MDKLGLPPLSSLDPLSVAHVGLLLQTTFDVIRATTPKHKPDASEMNKKDTFMSLKLAYGAVPLLAHVTFLTFAAWQSRAILDPATPWSSHPGLRAKHVASCVLALIGARLRLRCFKELGKFFTFGLAIRKEHKVIESGPYAWVRHPSYSGLLMCMFGLSGCAVTFNPALLSYSQTAQSHFNRALVATMSISVVLFILRIVQEEEMLKEHFGDKYIDYSKRVKSLIPFIF